LSLFGLLKALVSYLETGIGKSELIVKISTDLAKIECHIAEVAQCQALASENVVKRMSKKHPKLKRYSPSNWLDLSHKQLSSLIPLCQPGPSSSFLNIPSRNTRKGPTRRVSQSLASISNSEESEHALDPMTSLDVDRFSGRRGDTVPVDTSQSQRSSGATRFPGTI
jgi:hypothetical protein